MTWPQAEIGSMINARVPDKIERQVNDVVDRGAKAVAGRHRVRNEETFGPVAAVFRFASKAEVIAEANETPYGLDEYLHTKYLCQGGLE